MRNIVDFQYIIFHIGKIIEKKKFVFFSLPMEKEKVCRRKSRKKRRNITWEPLQGDKKEPKSGLNNIENWTEKKEKKRERNNKQKYKKKEKKVDQSLRMK